jgi:hypothetical protein
MISWFGVLSLVVLAPCCAGLILHYHIMKRRTRLDNAIQAMENEVDDLDTSYFTADLKEEYEAALAEYNAFIARFPFNFVAKILNLPHSE